MSALTLAAVVRSRTVRSGRRRAVLIVLSLLVVVMFAAALMTGHTFYPLTDVVDAVAGLFTGHRGEASFAVGTLRLPRALLAVFAGASFGLAGSSFQTMLRNPLASPDVVGISSGASAAAAFAIVVLSLSGVAVSVFAVVAGLGVAVLIYALAFRSGGTGTRLVLIGVGIAAMLDSVTAYVLSKAGQWDLQEATRWLTGSLNGSTLADTVPVLGVLAVCAPILLGQARNLDAMRLGDDTAAALGVRVERTRIVVVVAAVALTSFATAAAGPIAFVAFLSGPIAARMMPGTSSLLPAMLVGALLVQCGDLAGQFAFGVRYPVGVVTGILGAPYLCYLVARTNKRGTL